MSFIKVKIFLIIIFHIICRIGDVLSQTKIQKENKIHNGHLLIQDSHFDLPLDYRTFIKLNKHKYFIGQEFQFRKDRKHLQRIESFSIQNLETRFGDWDFDGSRIKGIITYQDKVIPHFINPGYFPWSPRTAFEDSLGSYFGYINFDSSKTYRTIESIKVYIDSIQFEIPDSLFKDLMNPNQFYSYYLYKPIEMYWDKKQKVISFYIIGSMDLFCQDDYPQMNYCYWESYIARIDIDLLGETSRFALPGSILFNFGWMVYNDFWPF